MSTKRRDNKGRVLLNGEIQEESGMSDGTLW
ncbi:integrase DNA-binding domain-containing protein [Roseburia faecis]